MSEEEETRIVDELQRLWARGGPPSALLRTLRSRGMGGGQIITVMQRAFALPLSKSNAITAWLCHGDDQRLDRFLIPLMPDQLDPDSNATPE